MTNQWLELGQSRVVTRIVSQFPSDYILAMFFWYVTRYIFVQGPKMHCLEPSGTASENKVHFPHLYIRIWGRHHNMLHCSHKNQISTSMSTAAGFSCVPTDHYSLSENTESSISNGISSFLCCDYNLEVYTLCTPSSDIPETPKGFHEWWYHHMDALQGKK